MGYSFLRHTSLAIAVSAALWCGCRVPPPVAPAVAQDTLTYFKLRQFIQDQWATYGGQPYTLTREVIAGDRRSSDYVRALHMDWSAVMMPFLEADIGYPRFTGKYRFSEFTDPGSGLLTYAYEADSPGLYTKKLYISTDPLNNRIVNLYAETARGDGWHHWEQKLYYAPARTIQITERATARIGPDRTWTVTYRFF